MENVLNIIAAIVGCLVVYLLHELFYNILGVPSVLAWILGPLALFGIFFAGIYVVSFIVELHQKRKTNTKVHSRVDSNTISSLITPSPEATSKSIEKASSKKVADKISYLIAPSPENAEYSGFTIFVFIIAILHCAVKILIDAGTLITESGASSYGYFQYDTNALITNILLNTFILISVILLLQKRKIGAFLFFGTQIIGAIVVLFMFEASYVARPIANCIIYALILCIRKRGVSGWRLLFPKNQDFKDIESEQSPSSNLQDQEPAPEEPEQGPLCESKQLQDEPVADVSESLALHEASQFVGTHNKVEAAILPDREIDGVSETSTERSDSENLNEAISKVQGSAEQVIPNQNNHRKIVAIVSVVLLAIAMGIGLFITTNNNKPENRYAKANELFQNGNFDESLKILETLATEDSYTPAKRRLYELYLFNDSIPLNFEAGIKYLDELARVDSDALSDALCVYFIDNACKGKSYKDYEKAEYYINLLIERQQFLDHAYFAKGNIASDKNDYKTAYYYWNKAAENGYAGGYNNMGWALYNGYVGKVDLQKALDCFRKSLEIDPQNSYALYYIGLFYEYGYGVAEDKDTAIEYFRKAADGGYKEAQKELVKLELQ